LCSLLVVLLVMLILPNLPVLPTNSIFGRTLRKRLRIRTNTESHPHRGMANRLAPRSVDCRTVKLIGLSFTIRITTLEVDGFDMRWMGTTGSTRVIRREQRIATPSWHHRELPNPRRSSSSRGHGTSERRPSEEATKPTFIDKVVKEFETDGSTSVGWKDLEPKPEKSESIELTRFVFLKKSLILCFAESGKDRRVK